MDHGTPPAILAFVTLPGHRPAPARVELVYRPAAWRGARALLLLVFFWGMAPLASAIPPHYP
ncbi:MAG TPA: hypothetical protein VF263_03255, partial [Longimicrobiaceae bacterium]